ncbi:MAG: V-type ATP synthase subunit D [Candidatus Omnitrophica bacterium]|nr:V-type ATP synthase subunit D [Candidatus Omnitrophota bacterium]
MGNVNIAATKTNLLKIKQNLELTQQGYDLLDEKRKILLQELTALIDSVDHSQSKLNEIMQTAYRILDRAIAQIGRTRLEILSMAVDIDTQLAISQRRIMGVTVPVISLQIKEKIPYCSMTQVPLTVDEAIMSFKEVLKAIVALAEKKIALLRLAEETRRTIRKVKALEKIYIPYYKQATKYISERLEEEARDSFALLKLIKQYKF